MTAPLVGVLDLAIVHPWMRAADVLADLVATAPLVEALGYTRLWVAEHHEGHYAHSAPEVVIPALAAATRRLRIGSAGVLLHFHSPLKVAESFRALAALFPGRIDLGVAAGITNAGAREALRPGFDLEDAVRTRLYGRNVEQLVAYCRNEFPPGSAHAHEPNPHGVDAPPMVLLGAGKGRGNMILAARYGTAFCYSLSMGDPAPGPEILRAYREEFRGRREQPRPHAMVAANVLCAESNRDAFTILSALRVRQALYKPQIWGRPEKCREQLLSLLDRYGADEMIVIPAYDTLEARRRGFELLAEVCGLPRPSAAAV
jgi:luciferase family oxidoreductase group 1